VSDRACQHNPTKELVMLAQEHQQIL
jgi:hypothetical protein